MFLFKRKCHLKFCKLSVGSVHDESCYHAKKEKKSTQASRFKILYQCFADSKRKSIVQIQVFFLFGRIATVISKLARAKNGYSYYQLIYLLRRKGAWSVNFSPF